MLYKCDQGVYDAASPPEGGPAEVEGISAPSLSGNIDRSARMPDSLLKSLSLKQLLVAAFKAVQVVTFVGVLTHFALLHSVYDIKAAAQMNVHRNLNQD